jgi:hypothetical protein
LNSPFSSAYWAVLMLMNRGHICNAVSDQIVYLNLFS